MPQNSWSRVFGHGRRNAAFRPPQFAPFNSLGARKLSPECSALLGRLPALPAL
jgi:hypothetical protein